MSRFVRGPLLLVPICAALLLAHGCGSSSSSNDSAALTVALADAASDDVTAFNLTISAISITNSAGAVHSILATPIVVDLASLTNFSQIVDLDLINPGSYTTASVTVDFTNASCILNGKTLPAAINDDLGVPLTGSMTLPLDFTAAPFTAVAGQHHVMELDFDFNQMLTVDLAGNSVEVVPTVEARFDRPDQNAVVAYGQGVSLNLNENNGVMELESLAAVQLKRIALAFSSNTVFQVNGVPFLGSAGLSALGGNPIGTWFQAFGIPNPGNESLLVTYIEAGTGSWNGGQDIVDGYVIDNSPATAGANPSLTVLGNSSNAAHTVLKFNSTFTVDATFGTTKILSRGSAGVFSSNAINVGQHIQAFGSLTATTLNATTSSGIVRARATPYSGTAVGAPVGTLLTLALAKVGPLDQALFTWADSGTTDPDPNNFAIDVGTLADGLTILAATPLIVTANMKGVDNAGPDIATATLVQDVTTSPVVLSLRDRLNGFTVVTATTPGVITFTISGVEGADETATLDSGFQGVIPLPTAPDPTVVAATTPAIYTIFHQTTRTTDSFDVYADFVTALGTALAGTETLRQFAATGSHDSITNAFAAESATAVLQ